MPQPKQEKLPEDSDEVKACEARLAEAEAQLATLEDVEIQAEHAAMAAVRQGRAWPRKFMGPTVTQTNLLDLINYLHTPGKTCILPPFTKR